MKIWRLEIDFRDYESFQLVNKDKEFLKQFKSSILSGKEQNGRLDGLEVEVIDGNAISDLSKFWNASGTMLFSEKAKICLEDLVNNCVEFIQIKYKERVMYIVNIVAIIDAVNYKNAVFRKLDTGLIVGLNKYSFITNKIKGDNIFKVILNDRIFTTEIFVTSEFKTKVEENKLLGFKFVEVWDSEEIISLDTFKSQDN